jgi:ATP-dependent protease ClpP protease subunit
MLTAYEKDVCIVASGYCYSAGVIIMQAAKRRAATQHTTILIHYGSLDIEGTLTPKDINELHQQTKMIDSFNHKILKTRWKGDSTALHNLLSKDVLLTAKQAKDYGLIDEVV